MTEPQHSADNDALPDLDRGALVMADLAWIETDGSPMDRTTAAIKAYLWAEKIGKRDGLYPSLNQWRTTSGGSDACRDLSGVRQALLRPAGDHERRRSGRVAGATHPYGPSERWKWLACCEQQAIDGHAPDCTRVIPPETA